METMHQECSWLKMDLSMAYVFFTIFCVVHTPSHKDRHSHTHPNFVFYFPSAAALNDVFPPDNLSEPEGAPAVATFLPAYKYTPCML